MKPETLKFGRSLRRNVISISTHYQTNTPDRTLTIAGGFSEVVYTLHAGF